MTAGKAFATLLIVLNLCASVSYLCGGEYKRAIYWLAAAVLTTCVTY